jgi:photosystem II stability/assembly factor-like uncharacterized protein
MKISSSRTLRLRALARSAYVAVPLLCLLSALVPVLGQQKSEQEEDGINTKRHEWFFGMRAYPRGFIPGTARLKALEQMRRMSPPAPRGVRQNAAISSSEWTSIGPQPINTYSQLNAGRIWALAVDPGNTAVVYAGTDGGGVWKTINGGTTWTPLTDQQASLGITSLALDPSNSATIYAGTGGSAALAAGILKSTDGGNTWTQITGPFIPAGLYPLQVQAIAVSASNGQVLLAAAEGFGIYRSTDGGSTWSPALTYVYAYEVFFDPLNPNTAYASLNSQGVYKSTDTGQTWSPINGSGANTLPIASMSAINIAIAPSAPGTIYAALKNSSGLLLGFYKTTDGGANWLPISAPQNDNISYWNWSLRVHPTNPNVVFAGSLLLSASLDGGLTWTNVGDEGTYPAFVHVDQHSQVFAPDGNTLYIGNDGGVWSTTTPSASSVTWNDLNTTFTTALFYPGLSIHPTNVNIAFGGTQDNGTENYQGNLSWNEVACGDGGWTAIDFLNPQNVYATCQNIDILKSTDGGSSWNSAENGISTSDSSQFIPPFVMDPSDSLRLYFGTSGVYQTTDGANTWSAISGDLSGSSLTDIAVAPSDPNTVYAGGYGQLYVTTNALSGASATWSSITAGLPDLAVTQIAVNPISSLTAYVTLSGFNLGDGAGHVYRTTNGGLNWTNVSGDLLDIPVNDLVIDPDIPNTLYIATDIGVFRSVDAGVSWLPLGSGLPYVVVNSLKLHDPTRTLRAATYGRGVWDLWVPVGNQVPITIASSPSGAPFQLEDGTIFQAPVTFSWTPGAQHTVTWLSTWTGQANTRYVFQGWADGGSNPRTITVPSTSTTYTANITAQYQLSLAVTPAAGGQLTAAPSTSDGYYNSGASVQIQAAPAPGYGFWYFSGGATGTTNPVSVTITQPLSVTGNFYCAMSAFSYSPYSTSSDSTTGLMDFSTGAGCAWTAASDSAWLTISPAYGTGSSTLQYGIAANSGSARTGNVTLTYNGGWTWPSAVNQDAAGSQRATVISLSPVSGTGPSTVATSEFSASGGYGQISTAIVTYSSTDSNSYCEAEFLHGSSGWNAIFLGDDLTSSWPSSSLPGTGTLSVSRCSLNVSAVSVSGSGNVLTLMLPFQFAATFNGTKLVLLQAGTSGSNGWTSDQQMGNFVVNSAGYTISGQVTLSGSGLSGVTVTLSGSQSNSAITNGSGNYSFTVPAGGNYTVTPSLAGYTFNPTSFTFNNLSGNQSGASFAASTVTYTISGQVTLSGSGLNGVTVTLSGSQSNSATTNGLGNYSFTVPAGGSYTVTPSLAGYTFNPTSLSFNNLSGSQTANFNATSTQGPVAISGTVTLSGSGLNGVTVTLSGSQSGTATTNGSGNYSFTVASGGNYTVTPSLNGYTFNPPSSTFNNLSSNETANFAAAPASETGGITSPMLVLQNQQSNAVSIWLMGAPNGTVIQQSPIVATAAPNWRVVGTADFNKDGFPDILLQNEATNQISAWYMGGVDGLTIMSSIVGQPASGWKVVGMGDFNRDGYVDLLLQNSSSNALSVWYLGPNFTVLYTAALAAPLANWHAVGVADFNGDGSPDILLQNQVTNQVSVWYMSGADGTTVLSSPIIATAAAGWKVVGTSDFNNDGVPDIALQNQGTNQVSVWYMGGPQGATITSSPVIATAAPNWSISGSGNTQPPPTRQPRLFLQNQTSNAVSKWEMGGTSRTVLEESPIIATAAVNWRVVATADFNNDGVPDILLQNQVTNQISVWYMGGTDGLTIMSSPIVGQPLPGWEVVGAADFNHDGNADLLLQNKSTNALSIWYLGPNFTVLSAPIVATPLANWHVVGVADFDRNGSPDWLLQNQVTNQVSIWYLSGSEGTTLLSAPIIETAAANWNIVGASDFNDDGVPDIVLQNHATNQVSVWYMGPAQGSPPQIQTYTSALIIQTAAPGWSILAAF